MQAENAECKCQALSLAIHGNFSALCGCSRWVKHFADAQKVISQNWQLQLVAAHAASKAGQESGFLAPAIFSSLAVRHRLA